MDLEAQKTWLVEYLRELGQKGYDGRTIKCYEADLNDYFRWLEREQAELGRDMEVSGRTSAEYLTSLEVKNKNSTINRRKIALSRYLQWMGKKSLDLRETKIPFQSKKIERLKEPHSLRREEVDRLIQVLNEEYEIAETEFKKRIALRDSIMFELLFYHGLQIQELVALQAADFIPAERLLHVRDKKGAAREERLYSDELYRKLLLWEEERLEFAERNEKYRAVMFLTKMGTPVNVKFLVAIFHKYKDLAGITQEATPLFLKHSLKGYAESVMRERMAAGM